MGNQFNEIMQKLRAQRVRARRYTAMLLVLAMLTSLSVSWRLHQVGTALTTDNEYCCGMEEHVHTDDCYTEELVCGYEEGEPEDPDSAFSVDSEPTIEEPEAEPEETEPEETEPEVHHHTADCYETVLVEHKELTCGEEEHTHDETCPVDPDTGDFLCGYEEHTHTDDCYTTETETEEKLVCGYEEGEVLSDGTAAEDGIAALEDTNTATSVAEDSSSEAVSEPVLHHHTEACYEKVLTCTIPEHTHTLECLADYSADVETDDDWEKYSVGLSDNWNEALLAVAKEQLGYKESEKNFQTDEALGDIIDVHHYTRYGAFYGNPYADWDVAFIAFCQHYAGIPKTEIPQRLGLEALRADMDAMGFAYLTEGEDAAYEAIPGDVVTYNKNGTADDETIGIVETVGDDSLTVISGAVEGAVAEVTVPFTDVTSTILVDQAYGDYVGEADDRDGSHDDEIAVQPADEMGAMAVAAQTTNVQLDWDIVNLKPETDGTITYDPNSDTFKTKLEMNFSIPHGQINADTLYYWEFPDSVTIPYKELSENFSPMFEYKGSQVKAGEYRLRKVGEKYRVEFKVDSKYYETHQNEPYVGNIEYQGELKATGTDENGNTIVKGDTGFKVTLDGKIKYPSTPTDRTDKYDLTTKKEGRYNAETGKLEYTVTVTSHRGTPDVVKFVDEIYDANNNTLHLDEPTVTVEEYQFTEKRTSETSTVWTQEGTEQRIRDVSPTDKKFTTLNSDGKAELTMTLPQMETKYDATQTERTCKQYKVTYTYDVKNLGNVDYKFHNDVTASSQKDNTLTIEGTSSKDVEVKNSYQISKSQTHKDDKGKTKVTWTIKVNENRQNIFNAKVTDSMTIDGTKYEGLSKAVANSIKILPNNGYHFIDKNGNTTTDASQYAGIQFDKADGQMGDVNTNQYTIVYTTEHDLKNGKYTVANEAQFVKPDGYKGPTDGATADIAGLNAGRNNYKEYDAATGITENGDGTISIPWKVRVDVSKVKTISKGTVLKDTILDSGHVMTGKQAKDWGGAFTWTDSSEKPVGTENGSFTDSEYYELGFYTDNTYNQTKPLSDLQDTDEIYGYQITLVKDVTAPGNADRMLIKYSTTGKIGVTKENSYRNRFYMDDQYWTAVYKYTLATITKTDGNGSTGTTTVNNETGEVTWKIVVHTDTLKLHEKITVVDELPTGIKAESVQAQFGYGAVLDLNVPTDGTEATKQTSDWRNTFKVKLEGQKLTMSLANPDGKIMQNNDAIFIIKGKIVSTNDGADIVAGEKNSYTNKASVSFDGGAAITSNEQTQEWTKKKEEAPPEKEVLTKGHSWDDRNQLMTYTVDINPDAKEFFAEEKDANGNPIKYDYLTLEDTFTLAKHPDSVGGTPKDKTAEDIDRTKVDIEALLMETKLYYAKTDADGKPVFDEDGKLVPGTEVKGWTLKTRVDSSTDWCNKYLMTIENVPNKTPLVLEYAYQISSNLLEVYPKTKYEYNDDSYININNVSNNIELSGTGIVKSTGGITTSWSSSSSGATLSSGNSVTIVKIEEGAENTKLAGAKFQLQKYNAGSYEKAETLHSRKSEYTTEDGRLKVAQSVTVTENSKEVVYDELEKDVLYRLIEVEPPAGYELPTEEERIANAVYFYSSSGESATIIGLPADVAKAADLAKGSKTVTITNKPNQTELTVRKVWEDENGNATTPGANSVTLQLYRAEYDRPPYTSAVGRVAANITPKGNGRFTNKDALTQQIADELTNLPEGSTFDVVVTVITGNVKPENERTDRDAIYWNNTKCLTKLDGPELYNDNSSKTTYTYHLTMKKGVNILRGVIDTSNAEGLGAWGTDFTVEIKNVNKAEAATKRNEKAFESAGTTDANGVFTLTTGDNWMKTFENLPLTGTDEAHNVIYYGYSVKEVKVGGTEVEDNRAEGWIVSNGGDGYTSGTITVTNHKPSNPPDTPDAPGYELPATGSTGTAPYTTAGAVLMGAALVGGYRRKRRQERRGE